jgi:benzylsuccinate CoA-transferase BbsF subunit
MAPHSAYRCQGDDAWCTIACQDDAQWQALARTMARPELAADPRFATLEARKANEAALDAEVEAWTCNLTPHEVMQRCIEAGVPAGVVNTPEALFSDPQLTAREHFVFMDHAEMGRYASDGNCFILSDATPSYGPSPLLGEHTEQICREVLGMTDAEYRSLLDAGVLS